MDDLVMSKSEQIASLESQLAGAKEAAEQQRRQRRRQWLETIREGAYEKGETGRGDAEQAGAMTHST